MADKTARVPDGKSGLSRRGFLKGALAGAGLASLSRYEAVAQMVAGPSARSVQGWGVEPGLIKLSSNEMPIGPSPRAVEAVMKMVYGFNRYSLDPTLYEKIARRHGGIPVMTTDSPFNPPEGAWISLGSGSSEILFAAASAYLRNGGETIEAIPAFGNISDTGEEFSTKPIRIPVKKDFSHDLEAMKKAINDNTKMIILTSPGNPTGDLIPSAEMKRFIEEAPAHIIIFVDEAYIDFVGNPKERIGAAPLIKDHPNVIVSRTFSKIFGMAGMAIGYGLAQPEVVNRLNQNKGGRVNVLAMYAASAALDDYDYIKRAQEVTDNGKAYFEQEFKAMGLEYVPSEASFMLVNVKKNSDKVCRKLEQEYRIKVGNGYDRWKMQGWLRVTAGLQEENEAFMAALKKILVSSL